MFEGEEFEFEVVGRSSASGSCRTVRGFGDGGDGKDKSLRKVDFVHSAVGSCHHHHPTAPMPGRLYNTSNNQN